jgi:4-amino-4-deoxy-L-arabinose transferase-like glycosyltransferase
MKQIRDFNTLLADERIQTGFLGLFCLTVFFTRLGLNGMANYDDCFYAHEAKEILRTGQWSVLHYNGMPSFHNAPLFMWMMALAYKVFGVSVYAAKFPSALMGLCSVLLVYFLGRALLGSWAGFISALVLATTYPFVKFSRHSMLDVTLAFFVALAMAALILALRKDKRFFWLWGLGIGLAILTKSLFGLFPFIVTILFLLLTRRFKTLFNSHFLGGTALFIITASAWVWTQYQAGGQDFINVHFKFIIMDKVNGTSEPWAAHLGLFKDLAIFYWPWLPLAAYGLFLLFKGDLKDKDASVLLRLWSLTVLVVMSFMSTRYLWYLMQSFPALALVSGYAASRLITREKSRLGVTRAAMSLGICAVFLLNALPIPLDKDREKDTRILAPYVKHYADKGARVVALREGFFDLNNALLFFSDHAAEPLFAGAGDVGKAFDTRDLVLCVAHRGDIPDLDAGVKEWHPVKYAEDRILIANQKLDTSAVKTWGGLWEK